MFHLIVLLFCILLESKLESIRIEIEAELESETQQ